MRYMDLRPHGVRQRPHSHTRWGHGQRGSVPNRCGLIESPLSSGKGTRGSAMIPDFNDDGYLPPGIHLATLEEVAARFGQESEVRQVQMESLRWLLDLARRAGVQRLVVNGSFVTDEVEPNDVDCVLLIGQDFPRDAS